LPPRRPNSVLSVGLLFGVVAVYLCLVGLVETFRLRWIIANVIGLGQMMLLITAIVAGFVYARRVGGRRGGQRDRGTGFGP